MSQFVIQCPTCSKALKLKDRSKIGKKAKCPKCEVVFVMQLDQVVETESKPKRKRKRSAAMAQQAAPPATDDDEVQFELAQSPQVPQMQPQEPLVGTAARWVPDDAPIATNAAPTQTAPQQSPGQSTQFPGLSVQADLFDPAAASSPTNTLGGQSASPPGGIGVTTSASGLERIAEIKKRNRKRTIIGVVVALVTAGAFWGTYSWAQKKKAQQAKAAAEKKKPKRDEETVAKKKELADNTSIAEVSRPTKGEILNLACIPSGAQALISLRPAELLEEGTNRQEFWYCLGPFGEWLTGGNDENGEWVPGVIEQFAHQKPSAIEHILIAVLPGERGEPAQFAGVVKLKEPAKKSELLKTYGGDRNDSWGYPVYMGEEQAFLIKDLQTIAICPADNELAEEMAQSIEFGNSQSDGMEALVQLSDADRHATVLFNPRTMLLHEEVLFAENVLPLVHHTMSFFNDEDIETALWAIHLGEEHFHSEILLRNRTIIREHQLEDLMRDKLKELPVRVWHDLVEKMNPKQIGYRRVIGRFPAMVQLFSKSTIGGMGTRYAQLVTLMPERAAPNLALGSLLAWDESTRTDFSKATIQKPTTSGPKLPALAADRLKMKIEVEFKRMPLQEAIAYIAEECRINQSIDGDALKDKGYTKNMPQNFTMNDSGFAALKKIISQYDDMCIVLDEKTKSILLTTRKFAAQKSQTVYEIP